MDLKDEGWEPRAEELDGLDWFERLPQARELGRATRWENKGLGAAALSWEWEGGEALCALIGAGAGARFVIKAARSGIREPFFLAEGPASMLDEESAEDLAAARQGALKTDELNAPREPAPEAPAWESW